MLRAITPPRCGRKRQPAGRARPPLFPRQRTPIAIAPLTRIHAGHRPEESTPTTWRRRGAHQGGRRRECGTPSTWPRPHHHQLLRPTATTRCACNQCEAPMDGGDRRRQRHIQTCNLQTSPPPTGSSSKLMNMLDREIGAWSFGTVRSEEFEGIQRNL